MARLDLRPRAIQGNITWTLTGATASFWAPTVNVHMVHPDLRLIAYHQNRSLYASLAGFFRDETFDRQVPVSAVMERMAASVGHQTEFYPAWQQEMADTAGWLAGLAQPPIEKKRVITVKLPIERANAATVALWQARGVVGIPAPPPTEDQQMRARAYAGNLLRSLRRFVKGIEPLKPSELRWLVAFNQAFGGVEPPYTHEAFRSEGDETQSLTLLGNAILNPSDAPKGNWVCLDVPLVHDNPDSPVGERQRVFQKILVVNDFARSWTYPHAALWNDLDSLGIPLHATALSQTIPNAAARKALDPHFKHTQWLEEESDEDTTPNVDAATSRADLERHLSKLASSGSPDSPPVIALKVGSTDPDDVEEQARAILAVLDPTQTRFHQLHGKQTKTWEAFAPGSSTVADLRRFERKMTPEDLSGLGIYHGTDIGDDQGRVAALVASGAENAPPRLVFRDPSYGLGESEGSSGSSSARVGDVGKGKSLPLKCDARQVIQMRGGVFIIDVSEQREWTRAAHSFGVNPHIVDPTNRTTTMDPLRVFTANLPEDLQQRADLLAKAERHTLGFYATRFSIADQDDPRYDILEGAVQDVLGDNPKLPPSSPNLLALIKRKARHGDEAAKNLVRKFENFARSGGKGRNIMTEDMMPLDLRTQAVIFSDPGVDLKSIEGQASIFLATAFAPAFMYATERFNMVAIAELRILVQSPWGRSLVEDVVTMARKGNAGVNADSQLARHYPEPELFNERFAAGSKDASNARSSIEFLGPEPTPELISQMQALPTGIMLYTDRRGRTGFIDVLPPFVTERDGDRNWQFLRTDREKKPLEELLEVAA